MTLREMNMEIQTLRMQFKCALREVKDPTDQNSIRKCIQGAFKNCSGNFEEQCVMENLKEVFEEYVKEIRGAA